MIPIKYNVRSLFVRKANTLMTIVSIASVVLVYVGVLALGAGLRVAFTASGDNSTVIVLREGANSEMESYFPAETHRILASMPGVARDAGGEPLASGETITLQILERPDGSETNAVLRGVEDDAFALRPYIQIAEGRRFVPGQTEIIIGDQLEGEVGDLELGSAIDLGRFTFTVVGIFDSGGSSYGSEIWGNVQEFGDSFRRQNYYSSTRLMAESPAQVEALIEEVESSQQINVAAQDESSYFEAQSVASSGVFLFLGNLIAVMMGFGACFAAANTMYAQVAARSKEIATLRVLGFRRRTILSVFVLEATVLGLAAGALGALLALPLNGLSAGTTNFMTFSEVRFMLRTTPDVLGAGMFVATLTAVIGGFFPALSASRAPIATLLREG